ncbi:hypothetical protein [Streptomyces narbonensis]
MRTCTRQKAYAPVLKRAAPEGFLKSLWSLIDPADLRWVVVTHDDRDHTGALARVLEAAPRAKVLTHAISLTRLSEEFDAFRGNGW